MVGLECDLSAHGQYLVTIPLGRYQVTATNGPKASHSVVVTPGARATVNCLNFCE